MTPPGLMRRQASIVAADLSDVVMVGGGTQMPGVQRALMSVFHVTPVAPDPRDAAAKGACMQARTCRTSASARGPPACAGRGAFASPTSAAHRCRTCMCALTVMEVIRACFVFMEGR